MFDQLTKIGKQLGGDLNKALQVPLRGDNWKIGSKALAHKTDANSILTPVSLVGEHDDEKEAILQGLIRGRSCTAVVKQAEQASKRAGQLHRAREGVLSE